MSSRRVLVVSPHPDDETLGCGGTLAKHHIEGDALYWMIATEMTEKAGYSLDQIQTRRTEIEEVHRQYNFCKKISLNLIPAKIDMISKSDLVQRIATVFADVKPNILYIPYDNDVHTDHKIIAEACISCTKWFRHPYIEKVLFYETLSETDFNINSVDKPFSPNVFVDITSTLDKKIEIMDIYHSEMDEFPFPRSERTIRSLAYLRGSQSGCEAAEAFELLRETIR